MTSKQKQEVDGVDTNNGICYRLHLLFNHGLWQSVYYYNFHSSMFICPSFYPHFDPHFFICFYLHYSLILSTLFCLNQSINVHTCLINILEGSRGEQDLIIRLIDSATKQVRSSFTLH